jgi:hypothetical protein
VKNLRSFPAKATRNHAPNLLDVTDGDSKTHEFLVNKDRLEKCVLGRMQPTPVRVIMQNNIALFNLRGRDLPKA